MMTKEEVIVLMRSSKTTSDWNDNCDKVKAAHEGNYPDYWYLEVRLIIDELFGPGSSKIKFQVLSATPPVGDEHDRGQVSCDGFAGGDDDGS